MDRTIVHSSDLGATHKKGVAGGRRGPRRPDSYIDRLIKLIPSEVIAFYLILDRYLQHAPEDVLWFDLRWVALLLGVVAVPFYLKVAEGVHRNEQLLISATSFVVWVYAIGGPFAMHGWYAPWLAASVLLVFTFFLPLVTPALFGGNSSTSGGNGEQEEPVGLN